MALAQKDFSTAEPYLQHAADLLPRDPKVLSALAYAENGTHEFKQAIDTAGRVHAMDHKQLANVHYVAAASAIALKDYPAAKRELEFFVAEDPTNALAPVARANLDIIARNANAASAAVAPSVPGATGNVQLPEQNLADSDHLKAELKALGDETADEGCRECDGASEASRPASASLPDRGNGFTVRKNVDEVAVFFSASQHGHNIYDLKQSDIQVRDNDLPPERVIQFIPQSKLPMRLALLIDTSGSVEKRLTFEKHAAEKFIERVLTNTSDLAFVEGFANSATVTQDFTADHAALVSGIEKLSSSGGTSIFDALSNASWKLAAYPEHERVARVLVILTDGEENSSHSTLKQAIADADSNGVTVYAISTRTGKGEKTDADKMLEALAERTGGEAYFPGDLAVLGGTFEKVSDLIRSRYLIAYRPAGFSPDGKFRSIAITASKDGKQLRIRSRKGYHARLEQKTPQKTVPQ